jgi:hypothetical protein
MQEDNCYAIGENSTSQENYGDLEMSLPTYDETYSSLAGICQACQRALYDLGKIRGRNDLQSDEELLNLVIDSSKSILNKLPCLQLDEDAIEKVDSKYGYILTNLMKDD